MFKGVIEKKIIKENYFSIKGKCNEIDYESSWSSSTDNDGHFLWEVPSVQGTNDVCKIRIQSQTRDDWFDESDATFTIADTAILDFDMGFETGESLAGWEFEGAFTVNSSTATSHAYEGSKYAGCTGGVGTLSKTVTVNSGILRFFAKSDYDYYFKFRFDGQEMTTGINSYEEWQLVEVPVDAGTYHFEWDWSTSSSRYVQIDNISFP